MNNSETYQNLTEAQLWRYFAGQATSEEIDLLASWVKTDDQHVTEFQRVKELYYITKYGSQRDQFDSKKAFAEMNSQTQKATTTVWFRPWMAIAAMITILLGTGLFIIKGNKQPLPSGIDYSYTAQNASFSLPDKSHIQLNKRSQLHYQTNITEKRAVVLTGEAYFDIQHNANRPFEISAGNLKVRVLGTAFNVNAKNVDSIVVSVTRGRVKLFSNQDSTIAVILTAGQSTCFVRNTFCDIKVFPQNVLAWKEHSIRFDATAMTEVVKTLENYFDTTIVLNSKNRNQQLTVQLKEPKLDSVLQLLQVMYNLKTTKNNRGIILEDTQKD